MATLAVVQKRRFGKTRAWLARRYNDQNDKLSVQSSPGNGVVQYGAVGYSKYSSRVRPSKE